MAAELEFRTEPVWLEIKSAGIKTPGSEQRECTLKVSVLTIWLLLDLEVVVNKKEGCSFAYLQNLEWIK